MYKKVCPRMPLGQLDEVDFRQDNLHRLFEKYQAERVIGMLHSFILLKPLSKFNFFSKTRLLTSPVVKDALEFEEKSIIRVCGKKSKRITNACSE